RISSTTFSWPTMRRDTPSLRRAKASACSSTSCVVAGPRADTGRRFLSSGSMLFRSVPEGLHLREGRPRDVGPRLDVGEAAPEAPDGAPQGRFGVHRRLARQVHDGEEEVPQLVL